MRAVLAYGLEVARHQTLNREQRSHMLVQERANLVIWNMRNRAETTATVETVAQQKAAEEESQTSDLEVSVVLRVL